MAKNSLIGKDMQSKFILIFFLILNLTQCLSYDLSRKTIQQGNLLPQHKIQRLKIGMSKQEVASLMGTSLLSPIFNNNRWDYAYTCRIGARPMQVRNLSLYFSRQSLVKIEHKP